MTSTRPAAVAGTFYPAAVAELSALLADCFERTPLGPKGSSKPNPAIIAGLVPHAGPIYSGACAAHFFGQLSSSVRRVILLGVNHRAHGHRAALGPWRQWQTPLGQAAVDDPLCVLLEKRVAFLQRNADAHTGEHSIEIQLPFLQRVLGEFTFVPISLSHISIGECSELGAALADICRTTAAAHRDTIILASSDLSHYRSPKQTQELDRLALDQVLALNPEGLLRVVEEHGITMCGVLPTAVMLFAARVLGVSRARLLNHCHSGDVVPMRKVVGYASMALEL
jgi:AmmeMemoRadiSam system protein B